MDAASIFEILLSTFRGAAPLILAAVGGLYSERSGVIQISLEGFMLFGAFLAATVANLSGIAGLGLVSAALFGLMLGAFYGLLVIKLKVDQIIAGTVINMLAWGGIPVVCKALFDSSAGTPALDIAHRLPSWLPIVLATAVVGISWRVISNSAFGLWLTFSGEKPEALNAVGINAVNMRWAGVLLSGALAGLGGATLSLCLSSSYTRNMTAGRGFMALAALILGKWRPVPAFLGCLLFGFCEALQMKLQGVTLPAIGVIPAQLVQILPYLFTLALLIGLMGESRAPAKLGEPL